MRNLSLIENYFFLIRGSLRKSDSFVLCDLLKILYGISQRFLMIIDKTCIIILFREKM